MKKIKNPIIFSTLCIFLMNIYMDDAHAQNGAISALSGLGITLLSLSEVRKVDRLTERIAERATERAIRRAAKRAEKKAEIKAAKDIEKRTLAREIKGDREISGDQRSKKEEPAYITNKKGLRAKRIGMKRLRKYKELYNDNGFDAIDDELLILVKKENSLDIEKQGYRIKEQKYLKGLDLVLVRIEPPKGKNLSDTAEDMEKILEEGEVSLNHLFVPEFSSTASIGETYSMIDISENLNLSSSYLRAINIDRAKKIKLGLIDTLVDHSHSALQNEDIKIEDFVPYDKERPQVHGTAVASIMVGNDPGVYKGVAPGASLFAASVFFKQEDKGVAATTESLLYALDWLVQEKVQVINMSLSGPANRLLEIAVKKILDKGVIIIAAVGNAGPTAPLLYPAAYYGVVAVTAVDKAQNIYWRANRGRHIIFAAPGVNIPTAHAGGGYDIKTGTSIAAPFVSAILAATENKNSSLDHSNIVGFLEKYAIDLGPKGFDTTYGHGLIQAVSD